MYGAIANGTAYDFQFGWDTAKLSYVSTLRDPSLLETRHGIDLYPSLLFMTRCRFPTMLLMSLPTDYLQLVITRSVPLALTPVLSVLVG
jgi:hypothetical protein